MHYLLSLSFKFALWGLLLLSFGSHGVPSDPFISTPLPGFYALNANGTRHMALSGKISFVRGEEEENARNSVLRLQLQGNKQEADHLLGFLISAGREGHGLRPGKYEINNHIDGFMSAFEGVFAFASIPALGEQPYFAREGSIVISKVGKDYVSGSLSVSMENAGGETLKVGGDFNAVAVNEYVPRAGVVQY